MGSGIMHTDCQLSSGKDEFCRSLPADRYPPFWAPLDLLYDATATDAGLDEGNHRGLIRISAEPNAMQLPLPRQVMPVGCPLNFMYCLRQGKSPCEAQQTQSSPPPSCSMML